MSKLAKAIFFSTFLIVILALQFVSFAKDRVPLIRFAQISDTHISNSGKDTSRRLFADSEKLFEDVVDQINNDSSIAFTVMTGDLVDYPTVENLHDFLTIAKKLTQGWYAALGNHDTTPHAKLTKQKFIAALAKSSTYFDKKGYYSFLYGDSLQFIILDGNKSKKNTAHGVFDQEQLLWLKQIVQASSNRYIVVALHYPIIEPFHSNTHHIEEPYLSQLKQTLHAHKNVILVLAGHYHSAGIRTDQHTIHATCPAVIEYPNAFRIITIYNDGTVQFEWRETRHQNLQLKSKRRSKSYKLAFGTLQDRVNTINPYQK